MFWNHAQPGLEATLLFSITKPRQNRSIVSKVRDGERAIPFQQLSPYKLLLPIPGNGATSAKFSLDLLNKRGIGLGEGMKPLGVRSGLCVTVPGAAALWEDTVAQFGNLKLSEVLKPAIKLAREGFPVTPVTAHQWNYTHNYLQGAEAHRVFKPNGYTLFH